MIILEDIYKESIITIKLQKGVTQDDTISPKLFIVVLEDMF